MKILFFTENFPPETNAAATRVFERALYWVKWGHDVTVVTCQPNFPYGKLFEGRQNKYEVETIDGIRVVRAKTYIASNRGVLRRTVDFLSFMVTGYLAARKEPTPDLVISTSPQFFAAVAAWWFAKRRKLRYIFELGDLWPASITAVGAMRANPALSLIEALELRMYRDADSVIALTKSFKDNLVSRGIDGNKIAVVINGVDLPRYGPRPRDKALSEACSISPNDFVIGYVGTHGMAHALDNVLDAAEGLRETPNIVFLFAGPGAERERLMSEAKRRQLPNVRFLAPQPKDRVPAVWSLCDVALVHLKDSPVFAEVIPSKIFEAMGMGLPILFAGPEGDGSAIVHNRDAGVIVPPEDAQALADAARALAADRSRVEDLAANSLAAAPFHSREAQARHMMDVMERVVAGDGNRVGDIPAPAEATT